MVVAPNFPSKMCVVTDAAYGGKGDGATDNTNAFKMAIADCAKAGGGTVDVPAGNFVTGAITLDNNINLHLETGATISFNGNASEYPTVVTRYQGYELMNHSPMVYAYGKTNVGITGSGTLDAQGTGSWNVTAGNGVTATTSWSNNSTPLAQRTLAGGDALPVAFIEPYGCTNVIIQGLTFKNSHWWQLHPVLSKNVLIDHVNLVGTNSHTDGIDPEASSNVVIQNSAVESGDDNIALKAGCNNDGRKVPSLNFMGPVPTTNVVIMNTTLQLAPGKNGGMITIGSEESGGVQHVFAYKIKGLAGGEHLLYMKSNQQRGGTCTDINIDSSTATGVTQQIVQMTFNYTASGGGGAGTFNPTFDGISISNSTVSGGSVLLSVDGLASDPIGKITLTNDTFTNVANPTSMVSNAAPVTYQNVTVNGKPQ
jgi:polygalacturonase